MSIIKNMKRRSKESKDAAKSRTSPRCYSRDRHVGCLKEQNKRFLLMYKFNLYMKK